MDEAMKAYLDRYPEEIRELFEKLRTLVYSAAPAAEEKLWAKLPSYYAGGRFVRLIPFKDHINIEAAAIMGHRDELGDYSVTPKGMLQIGFKNDLPAELLERIFHETLIDKINF